MLVRFNSQTYQSALFHRSPPQTHSEVYLIVSPFTHLTVCIWQLFSKANTLAADTKACRPRNCNEWKEVKRSSSLVLTRDSLNIYEEYYIGHLQSTKILQTLDNRQIKYRPSQPMNSHKRLLQKIHVTLGGWRRQQQIIALFRVVTGRKTLPLAEEETPFRNT
jgi:hypothetical protein